MELHAISAHPWLLNHVSYFLTTPYRQFVREIIARHNRRIHKTYIEELGHLRPLPEYKTTDYTEERQRVTNSSTILLRGVIYSVPSHLIGEMIKIHLYDDRLECFVGGDPVATLPRKYKQKSYERQINYRHLIESLSRKPGAFRNYIYKDAFFPTLAFKQTWLHLEQRYDTHKACKEYVAILKEAARGDNESKVNAFLEKRLAQDKAITAREVQELFSPPSPDLPQTPIECGTLESYGDLLRRTP